MDIDNNLIPAFRKAVQQNEMVGFAPWGNDFFVNYLAPKVGFRTFNIGGDKNLAAAQLGWPSAMLQLNSDIMDDKADSAIKMLVNGSADVLVIPYFDLLWSAHSWVCPKREESEVPEADGDRGWNNSDLVCLQRRRAELQPLIRELRRFPYIDVSEYDFFSTARLRIEYSTEAARMALLGTMLRHAKYPLVFGQHFKNEQYVLQDGWYGVESDHVWSRSDAKLVLPVPEDCMAVSCDAVLSYEVFGASPDRPTKVLVSSDESEWRWSKELLADTGDIRKLRVPLTGARGVRKISIVIPNAVSPKVLTDSPDSNVLGISLMRVDILKH